MKMKLTIVFLWVGFGFCLLSGGFGAWQETLDVSMQVTAAMPKAKETVNTKAVTSCSGITIIRTTDAGVSILPVSTLEIVVTDKDKSLCNETDAERMSIGEETADEKMPFSPTSGSDNFFVITTDSAIAGN